MAYKNISLLMMKLIFSTMPHILRTQVALVPHADAFLRRLFYTVNGPTCLTVLMSHLSVCLSASDWSCCGFMSSLIIHKDCVQLAALLLLVVLFIVHFNIFVKYFPQLPPKKYAGKILSDGSKGIYIYTVQSKLGNHMNKNSTIR